MRYCRHVLAVGYGIRRNPRRRPLHHPEDLFGIGDERAAAAPTGNKQRAEAPFVYRDAESNCLPQHRLSRIDDEPWRKGRPEHCERTIDAKLDERRKAERPGPKYVRK